ncbi:class II aldolase/adducin family protein, partial [Holdemania filiformis]
VEGKWKPSIEHNLHRYIFKNRPDVNAVVHVHSTYATAYASIEGIEEMLALDIEAANYLGGDLKIAAFAPPGSDELAEAVRDQLGELAGVLMRNHGSCCVGGDMQMAMTVAEIVEKTCYSLFLIRAIGTPYRFPEEYKAGSFERYCKFHREKKA